MRLGQVMLYVNDQNKCRDFWVKNFDLIVKSDQKHGEIRFIELMSREGDAEIVLHNKELISRLEPEVNLSTPSLMFYTENLEKLHERLKSNNIYVGEIVKHPVGLVFNFSDLEDNFYAVAQKLR